ncbi:hypothetical protein [Streptomyces sp. NBC_00996]|nr:hypothetical protein OG390_00485 [Streptomyces sp. NBC_00996]
MSWTARSTAWACSGYSRLVISRATRRALLAVSPIDGALIWVSSGTAA